MTDQKKKLEGGSMHETTKRLYELANALFGVEKQSEVARELGMSAQSLGMWEVRGVSEKGMLEMQLRYGCNANWLRLGTEPMMLGDLEPREAMERYGGGLADALKLNCESAQELQLLSIYRLSNKDNRRSIEIAVDLARKDLDILGWINQRK